MTDPTYVMPDEIRKLLAFIAASFHHHDDSLKVYAPCMEQTIFHKILDRAVPASIVYEDDDVLAFRDIHPQAKTHLLFIPKTFVASIADIDEATERIPGHLIVTAKRFAQERGITGYKLSFNVGKDGGQEVPYIHLHFLSPQELPEQ